MADRDGCEYCPESSILKVESAGVTKTAKCSKCGIGSKNFVAATVDALARDLDLPVVFIERVDCSYATAEMVEGNETGQFDPDEWSTLNGGVYHTQNTSAGVRDTIKGFCTEHRSKHRESDKICMLFDVANAAKAFTAYENQDKSFFKEYLGTCGEDSFKLYYHIYLCPRSELYEVIIPIYPTHARRYKTGGVQPSITDYKEELIGILIIGQLELETKPEEVSMPKYKAENANEQGFLDCLRDKSTLKDSQKCESIEAALEKHGDKIRHYLHSIRNRLSIRETDYLHVYQSELLNDYMQSYEEDTKSIIRNIKKCLKTSIPIST